MQAITMRGTFLKPLMAATAVLLGACSDRHPASPEAIGAAPGGDASNLAAGWLNNPDVGNGVVYRYESDFAVCWTDFSNGLRACHRTQQFPSGDCGAFDPIGGVGEQDVVAVADPDDFFSSEIVVNLMGRMWITVRDMNQVGSCYGARRIAEGWGNFHYTDNDMFGPDPAGRSRNNAYGFMAQGQLAAADGSPVGYSGHARMILFGDGTIRHQHQVVVR